MDEKTQRYLHRIDQIMLTPTKAVPYGRPSKSPLTGRSQHLDKYIKYELSSKIIQNIISKNHLQLTHSFFNSLRHTEFRQREKIYKFIAVQKSQKRQMKVDPAVSAKILFTVLKDLSKRRYADFINSLQDYSRNSLVRPIPSGNKVSLTKQRSARESTGYGVLMRTTTIPDRDNYKIVSEWIDDSSALEEKQNKKAEQTEKLRSIAAKTIVKIAEIKVQGILLCGLCSLQVYACLKRQDNEQMADYREQPKQIDVDHIKIMKKIQSSYGFITFYNKKMASFFDFLKMHVRSRLVLETQTAYFAEILNSVYSKHILKNSHYFFIRIMNKPKLNHYQASQLQSKGPQLMKMSGHSKQSKMSKESEVKDLNPLAKLTFYLFMDRIVKLIFLVSKMLIPMREAFMQIDNYASFAYRLEESLKVAPNRYLLEAFVRIKQNGSQKAIEPIEQVEVEKDSKLAQCLAASVSERLIDGFIHIKIMAESRKHKVRKSSARDSIIESTKKFIQDREEYTSQSYENWNELKSNFVSPSKCRKLEIEI